MSQDLLDDLTDIHGDGYGVSTLSKDLLRAVGLDVIQFRRNQQVAYRVVERSRDVLVKINGLISKIEESDPADEDWASFDLYQGGIDSLEDLLFGLADLAGEEAQRYLFTLNDVATCITDVEAWAENRKKLREAAHKLITDKTVLEIASVDAELQEEFTDAELQDDLAFYADLVRNIRGHEILKMKHLGEVKAILHNLERTVSGTDLQLLNDARKPDFVTYAVKFAFVVHGTMEIAVKKETEAEWKLHFKSKLVWDTAQSLALHIAGGEEIYGDFRTLQAHYDEFLRVLQNIPGVETPKAYLELMKLAGHIHRPYSSRALALVILCRALVTLFNGHGNRVAKNVEPLEDVFEETIDALKMARDAYRDVKLYNLEGYEEDEVIQAFAAVQERIKECYSTFGAEDKWASEATKKIREAEEKDKARVKLMNTRVSSTLSKLGGSNNLQETSVEVTVKDGGLVVGIPVTVKVNSSARLAAIRYHVARSQDATLAKAALAGHFEDDGGLTISLDKSVQEVKGNAANCKLVLSLSPSASDAATSDMGSDDGSDDTASTGSSEA
ncbi:hypothetical protein PENSPDRAFT_737500 [Peniophora sp. CONT]|nr:hypothetical protein PENSPDRAFT_737500 [Peniophora sp. CONT]